MCFLYHNWFTLPMFLCKSVMWAICCVLVLSCTVHIWPSFRGILSGEGCTACSVWRRKLGMGGAAFGCLNNHQLLYKMYYNTWVMFTQNKKSSNSMGCPTQKSTFRFEMFISSSILPGCNGALTDVPDVVEAGDPEKGQTKTRSSQRHSTRFSDLLTVGYWLLNVL